MTQQLPGDQSQGGRETTEWYQESWCPWTWDTDFWATALVVLGVGWVIATVFDIREFWDIAGGLLFVAFGISLLRAPWRSRHDRQPRAKSRPHGPEEEQSWEQ